MTGPAALQVLGWYLATAVPTRTGVGCPFHALPLCPNAFLPTSLFATADNEQHNGRTYPSSSTACSVVSALLGLIPIFLPPCLQHRMKRRRRLEPMEQALQTANRRTDHEFIQDFLLMLASLQTPVCEFQCLTT